MAKIFAVLTFISTGVLAQNLIDQKFIDSLRPAGRQGLHGMVVFGEKSYHMAHIPMLNMPHDMQIVAKVAIRNSHGQEVSADFSKETFTLKPNELFSLNDFARGTITSFPADVHKGSFELGGPPVEGLRGVTVSIEVLKVVRPLPSKIAQEAFAVSDRKNRFEINLIAAERNFQRVKNGAITLWCVKGPDFFTPCRK